MVALGSRHPLDHGEEVVDIERLGKRFDSTLLQLLGSSLQVIKRRRADDDRGAPGARVRGQLAEHPPSALA
jgi:hypothetical protein